MYLQRLVLHGFKSFADRTVVELEPGVTGIVGPNGCGKSNIADAIKWVLGEQSPKSLRASSMQDVLFEGADTRPAMSFCEVSLLFTDCQAQLGTAYHQVEVGRRVERDGASDYFINGKACRLRDIQQLFRDTGIGRVAYSFLQQGQIDRLLSANPVDRRAVFEEAAGISGFKVKREETMRKLGEVETNLARVGDILAEVSSSMGSLKRQAARAVRAQRLRRQLNALDTALVAYDLGQIAAQRIQKEQEIGPLETTVEAAKAQLEAQEAQMATVEQELGELINRQQNISNDIFETRSRREEASSHARFLTMRAEEALGRIRALEQAAQSLTNDIAANSTQRAAATAALAQARQLAQETLLQVQALSDSYDQAQRQYEADLAEELELRNESTQQDGQLASLRARAAALELEQHGLQAQLGPIAAQRQTLQHEQERLATEEQTAATALRITQEQLASLRSSLATALDIQAQLRTSAQAARDDFDKLSRTHAQMTVESNLLAEMNRRYEGFGEATKELLKSGHYTPLIDGLEIAPEATRAIEALLSLEMEAVLGTSGLPIPVASMREGQRVVLPHFTPGDIAPTTPVDGLQPAAGCIRTSPALRFLQARLEGCYVCTDESFFERIVNNGIDIEFVAIASPSGAMIDGRGLFTAPQAPASSANYVVRSQRIRTLNDQMSASEATLLAAKEKLTQLDHQLQHAEENVQRHSHDIATATAQAASYSTAVDSTTAALARLQAQLQAIASQTATTDSRIHALATQRADIQASLEALLAAKADRDERVRTIGDTLAHSRAARDSAYTALSEGRLAEANARHALQSATENEKTLSQRAQELELRQANTQAEAARLRDDVDNYTTQAAQKSAQASTLGDTLAQLEADLAGVKTQLDTQESQNTAAREQLAQQRQQLNNQQNDLMRARLHLGELQTRHAMLIEDYERRLGSVAQLDQINWRACLYEADTFARADEATLEMAAITLPSQQELEASYPLLDRATLSADCLSLRTRLDNIGPINESALEDYRAQEARFSTLKTQSDDLHAAKLELSTALMELNAQSSTLFTQTFDTVRENFRQTFEVLFGGGKADLTLATPDDPLNSGIEIVARPPGTQLRQLNLLSGGQKTMTAVALLFAIYQVKPSPFCVLDELDAPLDDANIGRFLSMLKGFTRYSQFVIITHNKRTMAACDVLYGVTMQERGVSKVLSMRLAQAESYSKPAPVADEEQPAAAILQGNVTEAEVAQVADTVAAYRVSQEPETTTADTEAAELAKIKEAMKSE